MDPAAGLKICRQLQAVNPYWIEEPTHPDDVLEHKTLADAIAPTKLALENMFPTGSFLKIICKPVVLVLCR
jgi:L-fuconate dehydratase